PVQAATRTRPSRRMAFGQVVVSLILLALIGLTLVSSYVIAVRPSWAEPLIAPILSTTEQSRSPTGELRAVEYDLEVTVPADANQQALREAFLQAYRERIRSEFGETALINPNVPISYIVQPKPIDQRDGQITYRARLTGRVWVQEP
ncbi:MAG: serine/threonine protein kinase, partial [Chloroflexus aggregans]